MKAPSEKHLENWIIENPMEFRNHRKSHWLTWLEAQCAQEANFNGDDDYDNSTNRPYFDTGFIQQAEMTCGYADLVGMRDNKVGVIELKKSIINEKAIVQLSKYINEIEQMILFRELEIVPNLFNREDYKPTPKVFGLAVGYGQPSKQTVWGCPSNISLVSYEYTEDGNYIFYPSGTHKEYNWLPEREQGVSFNNWLKSLVDTSIMSNYPEEDE